MKLILFAIAYLAFFLISGASANDANATSPANKVGTGLCNYAATCQVSGYEGACVSISGGCCAGTVTSGLCPGSSDIKCCTNNPCSTPYGNGHCMSTSQCSSQGKKSVPGYCSGPSDLQCCVSSSPTPSSTYDASAAVSWANSYCNKDSEWLCSEFAARAVHAGGEFPGLTDYGNYHGYDLRWVSQLHAALLDSGWKQTCSGVCCGNKGDVLIYNIDGDPNAHAAVAIGGCLLDQHNPYRCGTVANWGPNIALSKP